MHMEIPIHAYVTCYDGTVGKSSRIIVDLVTEQLTHVVVKTDRQGIEFIVPIEKIKGTDGTDILLDCRIEDVYQFRVFHEDQFNGYDAYDCAPILPSPGLAASYTMYHPYRAAESG